MLAEVNHFVFGPVSPVLALLSAALGCLLGIILATRSQKFTGRRRVRLLLYASISLGVTGIWQAKVVALLGLDVPATIVRYDPALLAASLGVCPGRAAPVACSCSGTAGPGSGDCWPPVCSSVARWSARTR